MKDDIPSAGNLTLFNFQHILSFLERQNKTGILALENNKIKKTIFIENGFVVFAISSQDEDRLGEILVRDEKISSSQRDESLGLSRKTKKLHGETLLELGFIYPKDLFVELKKQVREIVLSIFLWKEGVFRFQDGPLPAGTVRLKINMEELIREGNDRMNDIRKDDDTTIIREVNKIIKKIDNMNYYEVLGVDVKSPLSVIKPAYLKMVRRYHPDRFRYLSDSKIDYKFETLFSVINAAFKTLSSKPDKVEYDAALLKGDNYGKSERETSIEKKQYQMGIAEFNKGNFWGATDCFQWVTNHNPGKAVYWYYLSLALGNMPRRKKEAEGAVLKAIELEPNNARYYAHLGRIYLRAGMKKRAVHEFMTALTWDPTNEVSLGELKKIKDKK
jgi:curved DNA-binding protein CbpA